MLVTLDGKDGFGKHTIDVIAENGIESLARISLRDHIVGFLTPFAIAWSKTSFAVTLLHITQGKTKLVVWAIIISTNLLLIMAAFSFIFQCTPVEKLWSPTVPGTCWPGLNSVVGMLASAYSGFMDFVLALLPVSGYLVNIALIKFLNISSAYLIVGLSPPCLSFYVNLSIITITETNHLT